jgi:hypothetical protein
MPLTEGARCPCGGSNETCDFCAGSGVRKSPSKSARKKWRLAPPSPEPTSPRPARRPSYAEVSRSKAYMPCPHCQGLVLRSRFSFHLADAHPKALLVERSPTTAERTSPERPPSPGSVTQGVPAAPPGWALCPRCSAPVKQGRLSGHLQREHGKWSSPGQATPLVKCPQCAADVSPKRLESHIRRVHGAAKASAGPVDGSSIRAHGGPVLSPEKVPDTAGSPSVAVDLCCAGVRHRPETHDRSCVGTLCGMSFLKGVWSRHGTGCGCRRECGECSEIAGLRIQTSSSPLEVGGDEREETRGARIRRDGVGAAATAPLAVAVPTGSNGRTRRQPRCAAPTKGDGVIKQPSTARRMGRKAEAAAEATSARQASRPRAGASAKTRTREARTKAIGGARRPKGRTAAKRGDSMKRAQAAGQKATRPRSRSRSEARSKARRR